MTNPALLDQKCGALTRVYRSTDAQLLATNNSNVAYGCAAEDGLNTLIPFYDRRGWLIQASMNRSVQRILVAVPNCTYVNSEAGECASEGAGVVLVKSPAASAAHSLDQIRGMYVESGIIPDF